MTSAKCTTSFLAVVCIVCFCRLPPTFASADETAMTALSSKSADHHGSAESYVNDNEAHQVSVRAVPLSHKFTGLGKRSSTSTNGASDQQSQVDAEYDKRALPSSLRFTGLGKRRNGVGAAMRYAGLGKRDPEMPGDAQDGLASEGDYSDAMPEAVAGQLDRRRRFAVNEFDDVMAGEDVDGNQVLYGLRQDFPASKPSGIRYGGAGKRNKLGMKIISRVDPGMRYTGIGKRDGF